jgi:lysine 2,3-aminomutase
MGVTEKSIENGISYIRKNRQIREVLISGGDPLLLSDKKLDSILSRLHSIPHLEVIRIGSRVPCTLPMRITKELVSILKRYHPLYINTHFNHPHELTPEAATACSLLADGGIPLGCQTVLLKGINDDAKTLKNLFLGLLRMRVRPYYLFQGDLTKGTNHFRTHTSSGIKIMRQLIGTISGMAIPTLALDAPGGKGKIPLTPRYITSKGANLSFKNYCGEQCTYPENGDPV